MVCSQVLTARLQFCSPGREKSRRGLGNRKAACAGRQGGRATSRQPHHGRQPLGTRPRSTSDDQSDISRDLDLARASDLRVSTAGMMFSDTACPSSSISAPGQPRFPIPSGSTTREPGAGHLRRGSALDSHHPGTFHPPGGDSIPHHDAHPRPFSSIRPIPGKEGIRSSLCRARSHIHLHRGRRLLDRRLAAKA